MRAVIPRTRESARAGITALASLRPGSQLHRCASIISGGRKNQFGQSGLACLRIDRQLSRGARCGHPRIPARWRVRRSRLPALRRWQGRQRGRSQETGAAQGVRNLFDQYTQPENRLTHARQDSRALFKRKSNLQFQIGMDFPYATCATVRSGKIIGAAVQVWLACEPIIEPAGGYRGRAGTRGSSGESRGP
jgi:hypothetical protein